jgi:hypothetical protein
MKIMFFLLGVIFCLPIIADAKTVRVKGSVTKRGTYTQPHYKTSPNKTKYDNWSTKGNSNPFTGKKGTKDIYK